ncbi:hypothetical protein MVEN_02503000 [Mycena venus]|uniref:Uncharacterized protein n=1 Tax=Mycena venus TaxID=2733690 RepID=A0A8H6WTY2_9AGAR|nr:hypothetical protein MVEN_02503000 [Mycena venus]
MFHDMAPVYHDFESDKLVLPNLRRLRFGPRTASLESDDNILECFSLPGLHALSLPLYYVAADELLSFLERSSPALQELVIGPGSQLVNSEFSRLQYPASPISKILVRRPVYDAPSSASIVSAPDSLAVAARLFSAMSAHINYTMHIPPEILQNF